MHPIPLQATQCMVSLSQVHKGSAGAPSQQRSCAASQTQVRPVGTTRLAIGRPAASFNAQLGGII
eukprot:12511890-Heterocapsa_arctica.AAC.1